ncbi:MAG: carboxy-S-adenosyl-L-methionine synthase CmoA [Isosphaeraceae bacterium]|nr:carboxy-S-adenosyl-L-methionine synthase CmoA [Isosphaeraceae bacterium]
MNNRDELYASQMERERDFLFGKDVADVFDDMIQRSVPFYDEIQFMIAEMAAAFAADDTVIYDLGCSTGVTVLNLARRLQNRAARLVGVDSSEHMLDIARRRLSNEGLAERVTWLLSDLNSAIAFMPANVFVMNLTLQFIRPIYREDLVANVFRSLAPGGCLILVEKVLSDQCNLARLYIDLYHSFKLRNGYSQIECYQKRHSLENVLVPYKICENVELLRRTGFAEIDVFFRWYNFAGIIAVKRD